ncbi:MAG TPA: ribosome biogenesis GTPase Der [Blastocatellia bacterium]|nr:ribosome biogenesis GTPase Der [Blastocatellia bacterium]
MAEVNQEMTAGRPSVPSVVIVGRPNVGKSTFFNRVIGSRRAIVGDEPGITRDRLTGRVLWRGRHFEMVDTGGLLPDDETLMVQSIFRQAQAAIETAHLLLFMVDVREGLTPLDEELARRLRRTNKPVFVIVNKADTRSLQLRAEEFRRLGFEDVFAVSAEHGSGIGDVLDAVVRAVGAPLSQEQRGEEIALAVVGKPNVGKSSLVNRLLGSERVIVSPHPGTTRDAVDSEMEFEGTRFRVIDTAGIRRKSRVSQRTERVAVLMAQRHIERADVALLMIDATEGPTALDATIGAFAHKAGTSILIAVNKWDLVEKDHTTASRVESEIRSRLRFLHYAPILFISAVTGKGIPRLLELAKKAAEARHLRIPTSELNQFFQEVLSEPAGVPSRRMIRYITQVATGPPTFVVFLGSSREKLQASEQRFIENRLRERYEFFATPIRIKQRFRS